MINHSFVWAARTLVLNRSLLHVRRVEVVEAYITAEFRTVTPDLYRTASPFGFPPDMLDDWEVEELQGRAIGVTAQEPVYGRETPLGVELKNFTPWQNRIEKVSASDSREFFKSTLSPDHRSYVHMTGWF